MVIVKLRTRSGPDQRLGPGPGLQTVVFIFRMTLRITLKTGDFKRVFKEDRDLFNSIELDPEDLLKNYEGLILNLLQSSVDCHAIVCMSIKILDDNIKRHAVD